MNDRFKFRVWFTPDYQEPEMIYDAEQTYDNRCQGQGSFYHESFGEILEDKDCIVMQCTGLKDKNGKLIYEGDVIKIPDDYATYGQFACEKREVYWNEGFRLKPKWDARARGNWLEDTKDFEVIGNIYQNKELLEDNNG